MPPDRARDRASLQDILDSALLVQRRVEGKALQDILDSIDLQDMIVFRLLVIGEAAKRLSDETIAEIPAVPWVRVQGMRNRLIHGYDLVDFEIVWETINAHLPPMISAVRAHLATPP